MLLVWLLDEKFQLMSVMFEVCRLCAILEFVRTYSPNTIKLISVNDFVILKAIKWKDMIPKPKILMTGPNSTEAFAYVPLNVGIKWFKISKKICTYNWRTLRNKCKEFADCM